MEAFAAIAGLVAAAFVSTNLDNLLVLVLVLSLAIGLVGYLVPLACVGLELKRRRTR